MDNYQIKNILIATAKRRTSTCNADNEHVFCEIPKESRKRGSISQEGRYDKYGKLPMNMIMSQTARRDKNSQTSENCINESVPTSKGVISSYRFPNEKIRPWTNKTKRIYNAPTVVDVIQSKYYQLYRNNQSAKGCLTNDKEYGENLKQEDPLEASEFPKFIDRKKSSLHVKWEDESPMGFMKPSTSDIIHDEHLGNTSSYIDNIDLRKQNETQITKHYDFRFSELYNEKDSVLGCKTPEKRIIEDSCLLGTLKIKKEFSVVDDTTDDLLFRKNNYSFEDCFLHSVTDSVNHDASPPRQRWMNEFDVPEIESNSQLTCDLFCPENDNKFPLTCDLFEVPNLEEETNRLDEQNDSECSIYESPILEKEVKLPLSSSFDEDSLFSFQKIDSKNVNERSNCPLFSSESLNVLPKELLPEVYLSDPDDLLKTPKRFK